MAFGACNVCAWSKGLLSLGGKELLEDNKSLSKSIENKVQNCCLYFNLVSSKCFK